jgi:hydroxymethylbilane synthase
MEPKLRIGTRGSQLALAQSRSIMAALRAHHPGIEVEETVIQTKGDQILDRALSRIGDKGLFVTEIENALLDGTIDLAVHSSKDLPSATPDGVVLAAFPRRADPRDVVISRHGCGLADLPLGARIGTSSLRRACQLHAFRPDFEIVNLRGNVDTRLRKAATEDYDAIVLAAAGLERLHLSEHVSEWLDPDVMLPAVAQGALAIECRADDRAVLDLLAPLDDWATRVAVLAERACLRRLEGGCQVPIAAHAVVERGKTQAESAMLRMRGLVGTPDGIQIVRAEIEGATEDAEMLGTTLAEQLLDAGADGILERLSRVVPAIERPEPNDHATV